jgi:hypothetical protein
MSINKPRDYCTLELRYPSLLYSCASECQRPQLPINLGEDCRSKSTADPKIVDGKRHD